MILVDVIASLLLFVGCALALVAAVGLHRLDDVFTRMHAATKPAVLGVVIVCFAAALRLPLTGTGAKLALVAALQLLTASVGAHMIGRAAHRAGDRGTRMVKDQLAVTEARERD